MAQAEEFLGTSVATALMTGVERLDSAVSNLSALRDAAKECCAPGAHAQLQLAVKRFVSYLPTPARRPHGNVHGALLDDVMDHVMRVLHMVLYCIM